MATGQRTQPTAEGTARRILDHARASFDERGVHAVGIREIARDLGLSPGNVSYHFPTKEALVLALIDEMHASNNEVFASDRPRDFADLDEMFRAVMRRDLANKWLMRDVVSLMMALPGLRPLQKRMHLARQARVDSLVERLISAKLLDTKKVKKRLPLLRRQLITQLFFWVPSAIVEAPNRDPACALEEHAQAALALFSAYCTPLGQRQLDRVLYATPRGKQGG